MPSKVKKTVLISPFFIFFLVHSSQTGIGMLSIQLDLAKEAGYDAWIGLLLSGLVLHIILFIMFKLLDHSREGDIFSLHRDCFGNIIGNTLSIVLLAHFLLLVTTVFRSYVEVLQVWAFPTITAWELTLIISVIVYYIVSAGFRVITGMTFFSTIVPLILLFLLIYTLKYGQFTNLMPILNHDTLDILKSMKVSILAFLGFESLLIYLPFIRSNNKVKKWAHLGLLFTTITYTTLTIITFAFFTEGQLLNLTWPTLHMTKIVRIPLIERFEYIFIFSWLVVILPPICLSIWSVVRGFKVILNFKPSYTLLGTLILVNISNLLIKDMDSNELLYKITSEIGFYLLFAYVPLLYVFVLVRSKIKKTTINS